MEITARSVRLSKEAKATLRQWLDEEVLRLNFYRAHMLYFVVTILIASVIVYGEGIANNDHGVNGPSMNKLRYIDALSLCCSAMTTTGACDNSYSTCSLGRPNTS